jgi:2'-5' RNA ligase
MNYFLGFFPEEKANYKIRTVVEEVGSVFKDFNIPVRWVKPETYHITLYFLGEKFTVIDKLLLKHRLKNLKFKPFDISFGKVKLGISKKYKELVYIDINEGGEELRELFLTTSRLLNRKDLSLFVPHLTIGRVSKDLSMEEYRNLVKGIQNIAKNLEVKNIKFRVDGLYLIKSHEGTYSVEMKFDTKSIILE